MFSRSHSYDRSWVCRRRAQLLALAWPSVVSLLSFSAIGLVDTLFLGRLGSAALGSVGLGGVAAFAVVAFPMGLFGSGKVALAQADGAGQPERLPALVGAFCAHAALWGGVFALVGQAVALGLERFAADPELGRLARSYCSARCWGAPVSVAVAALSQARLGLGDARSPMRASLFANLANVGLNTLFIVVLQWGVVGAALGSVFAQGLELAVLVRAQRPHGFGLRSFGRSELASVWRLGAPGGVERLLDVGAFLALVGILGRMPRDELAAHQVALQLSHFAFLPLSAIADAACVLSARAVGAGREAEVRPLAQLSTRWSLVVGGSLALLQAFFARPLCGWFTPEAAVVSGAARLLLVGVPLALVYGHFSALRGVLRGAGDVQFVSRLTVACAWLCTPPLAYAFGVGLGWGAVGGWAALLAEVSLGAASVSWRLGQRSGAQSLSGPSPHNAG